MSLVFELGDRDVVIGRLACGPPSVVAHPGVHEFVADRVAGRRLSGGQVFVRVRSALTLYAQTQGDRYLPTLHTLMASMPWWLETLVDDPDARTEAMDALVAAKAGR